MLYLARNQISDISPLVANSGLGEGDEVWLGNNNLDLSEGSEDLENITALEDGGGGSLLGLLSVIQGWAYLQGGID